MSDTYPHANEVERAVLGAMLLEMKAVEMATELVNETMFYKPEHAAIFDAARNLYLKNVRPDQLSVSDYLRTQHKLEMVGGELFIAGIAAETRSTANVRHHCTILTDKAQKRRAILLARQVERLAMSDDADASTMLMNAGQEIERIMAVTKGTTFEPLANIIPRSYQRIEERANSKSGLTGITTGFAWLNKYTGGWQDTDLVLIAALPSCGKTTLGLNCAVAAGKAGHATGVFSLEMGSAQLGERLIADRASVAVSNLHYDKPTPEQWAAMSNGSAYLSGLPIYIDETAGLNVADVSVRAKRMKREHGIELVFIDYLQLMNGMGESTRKMEVDVISKGLKSLAKTLRIPVIAVSQLSRGSARDGREPELYDLRESGQLEQDADVVAFIWNPDLDEKKEAAEAQKACTVGLEFEPLRALKLAKQRNGPTGSSLLRWRKELYRFEELT